MTLIKSISGIRGTIGGVPGEALTPVDIVKFCYAYCSELRKRKAPNGKKYKEGVFGRKGLVEGKEFYSNGQVKFEGIINVNGGYGPNYPVRGNMYDRNGDLIFSGRFEYQKGGVGFPMMRYPRYRFEEDDAPKIKYLSLVANWEE